MRQVSIFDTTLRDGEQGVSNSMTIAEKIEIAKLLDHMGVNIIEVGFPASCHMEFLAAKKISRLNLKARISVFSRINNYDIKLAHEATKDCGNRQIELATVGSKIHIIEKLGIGPEELLKKTTNAIKYAKKYFKDISLGIEDAVRADEVFLFKLCQIAKQQQVSTVVFADTVGYAQPFEISVLINKIVKEFGNDFKISIHTHNDLGLSVANSLAALNAGAHEAQVTINGIGERSGNCALEELITCLEVRKKFYKIKTDIKTIQITNASKVIYKILDRETPCEKAIVGAYSFGTITGMHQDGLMKNRNTYELFNPSLVGAKSELIQGKYSSSKLGDKNIDGEIKRAYAVLKNRGLILVPSDVGFVLLGNSKKSIKKMYRIKGRPEYKPCMIIGNNKKIFDEITDVSKIVFNRYIKPIKDMGYLCAFIIPMNKNANQWYDSLDRWVLEHSSENETVSVPFNAGKIIDKLSILAEKDNLLIVGSSANKSGSGNSYSFEEVPQNIIDNVDYIIYESKPAKFESKKSKNLGGTILDLSKAKPKVFRKGVLFKEINNLLNHHNESQH